MAWDGVAVVPRLGVSVTLSPEGTLGLRDLRRTENPIVCPKEMGKGPGRVLEAAEDTGVGHHGEEGTQR